ncbi:MAG: VWA domain-containing protein, partial [Propionibacteriaceae bacterium]|nr:VWA domain-containing protein [Propionibacteriaceae bacterium]
PKQPRWVRHLAVAMSLCSLAALTLAWAQPMGIDKVPRERATVILVIDTSRSMAATDVSPDRLSAAKEAAREFLFQLPEGYNVGVVELAGSAVTRVPPTIDRGVTERAIAALGLADGTAIGSALELALKAAQLAPGGDGEEPAPAMIVLLSDGSNTQGPSPDNAVAIAAQRKVPVFTIAYGTDNGWVDLDGKRERVAPNPELLRQIAQRTGGEAFDARSADRLKDAYREIGSSIGYEEVKKPVTANYAFGALGFAIVAALGAVMMAARWP